jgi:hypothetical protein
MKTENPSLTQPLLIPRDDTPYDGIDNPRWFPISFGSMGSATQYKTNRSHFYFTASTDGTSTNFYAFNKNKMGRYQFVVTDGYGNYEHRLLDGSPYDYILDKKTVTGSPQKYYADRKWVGSEQVVSTRKTASGESSNLYFERTIKAHATDQTVYQVNEWTCSYCKMEDGDYVPIQLYEIRTYDLKTGAMLKSSFENNQFYTDMYMIYGTFSKGDNVQIQTYKYASGSGGATYIFKEFNRDGLLVGTVNIPQPATIYTSDSSWNYMCGGGAGNLTQGLDGEWYRYEEFGCWGRESWKTDGSYEYRTQHMDEVYFARYNANGSLAWRVKLAGRQTTPRESFSWKMNGGGFDNPLIVVNPLRNELLVKTHSYMNFDGASYIQAIDMTSGAIKPVDPALTFDGMTKNFNIDWNGNYVVNDPLAGKSLSVDNKWIGYMNSTGRIYNPNGSLYSSYNTGGTLWTSYMYGSTTGNAWYHELIGDGMTLSLLQTLGYMYVGYDYVPWLNKGTPSTDPAVAPGFTLGQFLSPFALANHEMSFTLSLDDADYDRDLAGFSFRAQNAANRYALETDGAVLYLSKYVNGSRTVLQQTNYPFVDGTAVSFKIKTLGSRIEVYVNGAPYFDVTDGGWTSGRVGPFSNKSYVQFGTVTAKELKAPEVVWSQDVALWDAGSARAEVRYTNILFTDPENDPAGPYRWRFAHTPKFVANQGMSALHGQTFSSMQLYLDKVGVYDVTLSAEDDPHPSYRYPSTTFAGYRKASNEFAKRIVVHRKPAAVFTLSLNADKTVYFNDSSYDPDRWASSTVYSPAEDGKDYQATRGIFERKYYYITPAGAYVEGQLTRPSEFGLYRVGLAVRDEYGAWSDWAVQTIQIDSPFPPNAPPVAAMTYPSGTQASPTMETSRRPALRWNQTDVDPGTVFTRFQVQVTNEANTATVLDSGEQAQHTTATAAQWIPTSDLPTGRKLRVRVRTFDGAEWSAWSAQTWLFINNAPAAELTYPTGTQANPTVSPTPRPTIRWSQTDPDPGTVFEYFEVEISNEANTTMIADSGQHYQHTSSANGSWTVDTDLPLGQKLRTRVRVFDGYAWSPWSATRWLLVNRPPVADFAWSPAIVYESDDVTLTNLSTDPDGDALSYQWTITRPDGTVFTSTVTNPTLPDVARGSYAATLRATDSHGAFDETTKSILVLDLTIAGGVAHIEEWEAYRQAYNAKFPDRARAASDFWAGEALLLSASVTNTGSSATKPVSVTATLVETGDSKGLSSGNQVNYSGTMAEAEHAKTLTDGLYVMRFTVHWSNGHAETDDVPFRIVGNILDVIVNQQRL